MDTHVVVQYTVPNWDDCCGCWPRECYFEGDVKTVDWDGLTLKIGRRTIYSHEHYQDFYDSYDSDWDDASANKDYDRMSRLEFDRKEADTTDILYLKIGDKIFLDIRKKDETPKENTSEGTEEE